MRYALMFNIVSIVTFLIAVGALSTKGLNLGVEFTGGTVMEVSYENGANVEKVREVLTNKGLQDVHVQTFGDSRLVLIRLPQNKDLTGAQLSEVVIKALRMAEPAVEVRRVDFVGSQVGKEMVENGGLAILFVSIGIIIISLVLNENWSLVYWLTFTT